MSFRLIDGKKISQDIMDDLAQEVKAFEAKHSFVPGLAVVIVGDNPASWVYVNRKKKACEEIGFQSWEHVLPEDVSQDDLLKLIEQELNQNKDVHGILVQLPLPNHLNEGTVLLAISPDKDVDGFHPFNVGQMTIGQPTFLPCTPFGIFEMLKRSNIATEGKHVVVIGRSNIVGKPIALIMLQKAAGANATVTVCHSRTHNMAEITCQADILIAAIGQPCFVTPEMVRQGAVVIDVGINHIQTDKGYRLVGDVDFERVAPLCQAITPVPGGVGPMTIAMLLKNTLKAAEMSLNS